MRSIFSDKKAQIPTTDFLGSIVNGIRSVISWFLQTAPKPLLIVFFLLFILLMGNTLIPLIGNIFGYHCDTNSVLWRSSIFNVFTNFDLLITKPELGVGDTKEISWGCGSSGKDGTMVRLCTDCPTAGTLDDKYCTDDGYRLSEFKGIYKKYICNYLGCAPPEGYYYNFANDNFECFEDFCINQTLDDYNKRIYESEGATPVFENRAGGNYSVTNLIYFKCGTFNPTNLRLTVYGLDVFDYKIWVILLVLAVLFKVYMLIKN